MWDFHEEVRRIRGVIPGLPIPAAQHEEIIETCLNLDRQAAKTTTSVFGALGMMFAPAANAVRDSMVADDDYFRASKNGH